MSKLFSVYCLTFPNGKRYFGITTNYKKRMREHKHSPLSYKNRLIAKAINKYCWDNIKKEILFENLTAEEAYKKEIKLIADNKTNEINNGYNISSGGRTNVGYKNPCVWNKGKKLTEEHKENIRKGKEGKDYSEIYSINSTKYKVQATNKSNGESRIFKNVTECSEVIGAKIYTIYNHIYRGSKLLNKEWKIEYVIN